MRSPIKNASEAKYSTLTSTPSGAKSAPSITTSAPNTGARKTPQLELTGVRSNTYLYSLRKAFREFISEECSGYCYSELRLTKKIEAARLLFPEDMKKLDRSFSFFSRAAMNNENSVNN